MTPAAWNKRFLPIHFPSAGLADFHEWLDSYLPTLGNKRRSRTAIIAPREGAKSTWITLAYVLRCALEGREPYILILSDSDEQAALFTAAVRNELEDNDAISIVYNVGRGKTWRGGRLILGNGVVIESLGKGSKVRGRKDRHNRPSLIIVDDPQGLRDIASPIERQRTLDWLLQEVIPAGSDTCNIISVGSALHRDALAVRAQALPGWIGRTFPAILRWPDRLDMWTEWERLATNLADPERNERSAEYLETNREAMTSNALTYWPSFKPIESLMRTRAELGPARFETEYQGVPGRAEGTEWPDEYFNWPGFWFDDWPTDVVCKVQTLDPSKGSQSKPGDYQAHIMLALEHKTGTIFIDADFRREPITDCVGRAIDLYRAFGSHVLEAEANNTMGLLLPEFQRQFAEKKAVANYQEITHTEAKLARIRRPSGYFARKQIRVRNSPGGRLLVEQWRDVPHGDYDDGPDAVGTAINRLEQLMNGT